MFRRSSPQERAIAHGGGGDLVRSARQALQKAMEPELTMAVERLSGRSVIACLSHDHLDPDIVVDNDPAKEYAGIDQQLQKGIEVVLEDGGGLGKGIIGGDAAIGPNLQD